MSLGLVVGLLGAHPLPAADTYMAPDAFVQASFDGTPPDPQVVWLTGELREQAKAILGHPPDTLRVRYWARDGRSVWILEEIGKEKPITTGYVVEDGAIRNVKVLIYRETRGWEVRYPFFTDQFNDATLSSDLELDTQIDGISGATLSVSALKRLARLALLLHRHSVGGS